MTTRAWIGRLTGLRRVRSTRISIAARLGRRWGGGAESLEERRLLAYLFVDFGDNFTGGTLTTTEGGLRDISGNPSNPVLGISLGDKSGFNAGTQLNIVAQSFTASERDQMMAVVERDYAPLNITVVELTASPVTTADGRTVRGASSMTDVINTLGAGPSSSHDAYIFVATFIADPTGPNTQTYGPNGGGLSPGGTVLGYTTNLSSAKDQYDEVSAVYSGGGFSFNTLNNIAHEAGHDFGLQHSLTNSTGTVDTNLFPTAELMSYLNTNTTTSSMFTRYPMPRGDGNSPGYNGQAIFSASAKTISLPSGSTASFTGSGFAAGLSITVSGTASNNGTYVIQAVTATKITLTSAATLTDETSNAGIVSLNLVNYNDLSARDGQNTNYDQLRADPNIGPNPLYDFVSGTGAYDVIKLSRSGSSVNVSVTAYGDAAHTDPIPVPSVGGTAYSYSLPISAFRTILIYTGGADDQVFIDGDLGESVLLDGMLGTDSLIVNALNASNVVYAPNPSAPPGVDIQGGVNVASYGGTITVGGNIIAFTDFRPASSVTIQNAGSVSYDTSSVGDDDLTVSNTTTGTPQLTGTVDNGVAVVPLDLTGVKRLAVTTGIGNDTLIVNSTNGLVTLANGIVYNGGLGANDLRLVQTGGSAQSSDTYTVLATPGSGSDVITGPSGTQSVFFQNLAPVFDNVPGPLTVVGTNANNVINYSQGATPGEGLATVDDAEPIDFTNKTSLTLRGLGGDDTITINNPFTPTGLTAITADGGSGNNTLVVNAQGAAVTSAVATATTVSIAGQLPVGYSNIQQIHIINSTDALTSTPTPVKAVEGAQAQDVVIGSFAFSDTVPPTLFANPADFTASITWGDGTTTAGTIVSLGTAGFEVRGTHTYATFGTYPVSATITDKGSSRTFTPTGGTAPVTITSTAGGTATIATTATVADAPLASQGAAVSGVEGLPLSTLPQGVVVATFTDLAPGGVPADYTATIAWGDGTTSAATQIVATGSPNGVTFLVFGNHTYAEEGEYSLSVTIRDTGGSRTTATSLVHVADAPLTAGPAVPINTIESPIYPVPVFGAPIFNGLVGTFSDANVNAPASDFRATIDWGDGTAPTFGTITKGATPAPSTSSAATRMPTRRSTAAPGTSRCWSASMTKAAPR
ncbi:beta strand repeat-containing protein [Singulisphaera sp. PoT]|uniref:beta strand repeat-containing protein n=1 Tax=Singulisphaera sp. PoT TaxID=3411797 RepID=UPI003BF5EF1E